LFPFNLTNPHVLGDKGSHGYIKKYLPFGVRVYAFTLDEEDHTLELTLKNDTNKIVLKMRFKHATVDRRGSVDYLLGELLQTRL
jgi:hypothetical protein